MTPSAEGRDVNHRDVDRIATRSLAIVGLTLFGLAVTVLAATSSPRSTWLAIVLGGVGAGVCGGTLLRRHLDRDAGLTTDE